MQEPTVDGACGNSSKSDLNPSPSGTQAELSLADATLNPTESKKEEEEEDDKVDEGKDIEAEKAKFLKKRQYVRFYFFVNIFFIYVTQCSNMLVDKVKC